MCGSSERPAAFFGVFLTGWRRRVLEPSPASFRRRLALLCGDRPGAAVALVGCSVIAGLTEAGLLTVLAEVAGAMVAHAPALHGTLGPIQLHPSLPAALALALGLAAARLLLGLAIARLPARIAADMQARWRSEVLASFTHASWTVQSRDREGHLQELMTSQVNQAIQAAMQALVALPGGAMFLVLVIAALALNPLVAVIVLLAAGALFWLMRPLSRVGRSAARDLSQASMDHAAGVSDVVRLAEESHVFGAAGANERRISALIEVGRHAFFRYLWSAGLVRNIYQSFVMVLIVVGLISLYAVGAGNVAALGAVVLMLLRSTSYAQQFQGGFHALNQAVPYIERIERAIDRYRSSAPARGHRPLARVDTVACEEVTFGYGPDRPALRGVSFSVGSGEAIGIVGPSGAGKSTLIQVLLRLREPDAGTYLINGSPAGTFRQDDWQRRVAYVPQEPRVMHASVADNIRFFRDLDDAAIERAARRAHVHDEIMRLPDGYDTLISQVSNAVSGGQRQRLCIARALAAEPEVLMLDEPTSALDMASETAVQASLASLQGRMTLFVAAHRLSTLRHCDRVLVLVDGAVDGFASGPELAQSSSFYQVARALTQEM